MTMTATDTITAPATCDDCDTPFDGEVDHDPDDVTDVLLCDACAARRL